MHGQKSIKLYKHKIEAQLHNHCCLAKASSIAYSECVSAAFFIQHAKRMRRIIQSSLASLVLPYISTLFHKRQDFFLGGGGGFTEHKIVCFDFLCNFFSEKLSF